MSMVEISSQTITPTSSCGCGSKAKDERVFTPTSDGAITLSLPGIHCAGCISSVEKGLACRSGVNSVRVNLSLKRVSIDAEDNVTPDEMISALADLGYEAHELQSSVLADEAGDERGRALLRRLAVAGFAAMNVMLLSVSVWAGAESATRDFLHWLSAAIALPTIAYAGQPFFQSAATALGSRRLNMDVPISLAIILAGAMSLFETWQGGEHAYFDAALSLTFFLLAGRYLDHKTRASARSAAQELAALEVPRAMLMVDGIETEVAVGDLKIGDVVSVKPGGRIPVDGVVVDGASEIDRSLLTGESLPVFAGSDTVVSTGEINLTGALAVRVTALAVDSSLQKMTALVALAENARTRYTSLADRAAAVYAPGVHLLAALALVVWFALTLDLRLSINIAIAVLIITCPCALGLAVPAVTTAASGRLFRKGVLLKNGTALERLAEVDTVVFDKTGTLTRGEPELVATTDYRREDLALAAALAQTSSHPLASALVKASKTVENLELPELSEVKEVPGYGVQGRYLGLPVRLGRAAWVDADEADQTSTFLKHGDGEVVAFRFTDELRVGAKELLHDLNKLNYRVHLISGDSPAAVDDIAGRLGITNTTASALPAEKAEAVKALQDSGRQVLMIGDGLNDTGALSIAHVSISPASGIDAARVASDIVLLGSDLGVLSACLETAKSARRRIKENFSIAALYNLIAVPIALVGLATPLIAALAMSASSITVTLNAWRLR